MQSSTLLKRVLRSVVAVLLVPTLASAASAETLLEAAGSGVNVYVSGTGSSAAMCLELEETSGQPRLVVVPVGTVFAPCLGPARLQRMAITSAAWISLPARGRRSVRVQAACLDIELDPPGFADVAWWIRAPDPRVVRIVERIDDELAWDPTLVPLRGIVLQMVLWRSYGCSRAAMVHHVQRSLAVDRATAERWVDGLLTDIDTFLSSL